MLKEAGIEAYPVLIGTKELRNTDPDFPMLMFNHAIAAARVDGQLVFFDPTAETCAFGDLPEGDQGRNVLLITPEGPKITPIPFYPSEHNTIDYTIAITVHPDESISASRSVETQGQYAQGQRFWLRYTPPQLIEESLQAKIQDFAVGAKLLDYRIYNLDDPSLPMQLSYEFSGRHFLSRSGKARIFPPLALVSTGIVSKDERVYPLDLGLPEATRTSITITLPKNFVIKYLPDSVTRTSKWLDYKSTYEVKGAAIVFTQEQKTKVTVLPRSEYLAFKVFLESLARDVDSMVIVEETSAQGAGSNL